MKIKKKVADPSETQNVCGLAAEQLLALCLCERATEEKEEKRYKDIFLRLLFNDMKDRPSTCQRWFLCVYV